MARFKLFLFTICILLLARCRLSEHYVVGKWSGLNDTLHFMANGKFSYSDSRGYYDSNGKLDGLTDKRYGSWLMSGQCVNLKFESGTQKGSDTNLIFCRRAGQFGRGHIYRQATTFPSNKFVVLTKIKN